MCISSFDKSVEAFLSLSLSHDGTQCRAMIKATNKANRQLLTLALTEKSFFGASRISFEMFLSERVIDTRLSFAITAGDVSYIEIQFHTKLLKRNTFVFSLPSTR